MDIEGYPPSNSPKTKISFLKDLFCTALETKASLHKSAKNHLKTLFAWYIVCYANEILENISKALQNKTFCTDQQKAFCIRLQNASQMRIRILLQKHHEKTFCTRQQKIPTAL
ncbi:hypothetical protein HWHPT5561_08240 [Petrotoga sp. HWH.PT.55.6.1]|nr:hypothetical protein X926_00015 [Petrotoga sp. HWHPT.55.6.3]RPD35318.1 hypothetical protein HWHPT5561_08240 [Petrotoga sp. HWH.PT.55.6.1]